MHYQLRTLRLVEDYFYFMCLTVASIYCNAVCRPTLRLVEDYFYFICLTVASIYCNAVCRPTLSCCCGSKPAKRNIIMSIVIRPRHAKGLLVNIHLQLNVFSADRMTTGVQIRRKQLNCVWGEHKSTRCRDLWPWSHNAETRLTMT